MRPSLARSVAEEPGEKMVDWQKKKSWHSQFLFSAFSSPLLPTEIKTCSLKCKQTFGKSFFLCALDHQQVIPEVGQVCQPDIKVSGRPLSSRSSSHRVTVCRFIRYIHTHVGRFVQGNLITSLGALVHLQVYELIAWGVHGASGYAEVGRQVSKKN